MFWLIVGGTDEDGAIPLGVDLPGEGEEALAVFSFEEEARMYLRLNAPEGRWCVEVIEAEKLASMLLWGGLSWVKRLALDPMPPQSVICKANDLVCVSRETFLDLLLRSEPEDVAMVGSRGGS